MGSVKHFVLVGLVIDCPTLLSVIEFIYRRVQVNCTVYRIRNGEVRLKTSEESLNVSKGLFSIRFENFIDAAI